MKKSIWYLPTVSEQDYEIFNELRAKPELSLVPDRLLNFLISRGFKNSETIYNMFYQI